LAGTLAWASVPAPVARGADFGEGADGAAIAAGLAIAVVAVYGLVTLRSDVENYSDAGAAEAIDRAVAAAEASPVVLEALAGNGTRGSAVPDGVAVGWKVRF